MNHQHDYRILLSNSFETLPIEDPTNEDNSTLPSFDPAISKRRKKKKLTKHQKQREACITNDQYEEPLEQRKTCIVPEKRTDAKATKLGKKISLVGDRYLNRIKRNIFQKSVNRGENIL